MVVFCAHFQKSLQPTRAQLLAQKAALIYLKTRSLLYELQRGLLSLNPLLNGWPRRAGGGGSWGQRVQGHRGLTVCPWAVLSRPVFLAEQGLVGEPGTVAAVSSSLLHAAIGSPAQKKDLAARAPPTPSTRILYLPCRSPGGAGSWHTPSPCYSRLRNLLLLSFRWIFKIHFLHGDFPSWVQICADAFLFPV